MIEYLSCELSEYIQVCFGIVDLNFLIMYGFARPPLERKIRILPSISGDDFCFATRPFYSSRLSLQYEACTSLDADAQSAEQVISFEARTKQCVRAFLKPESSSFCPDTLGKRNGYTPPQTQLPPFSLNKNIKVKNQASEITQGSPQILS